MTAWNPITGKWEAAGKITTSYSSTDNPLPVYQNANQSQTTSTSSSSNWEDLLKNQKEVWETAFGQRQQEAEDNASRAFRYRDQEANRQFGFDKDMSRQSFEQDRTIRGDELRSVETRELAQQQARERLQGNEFKQQNEFAGLQQQLKQRQQESERGAAMSVFRGGR